MRLLSYCIYGNERIQHYTPTFHGAKPFFPEVHAQYPIQVTPVRESPDKDFDRAAESPFMSASIGVTWRLVQTHLAVMLN